MVVSFDNWEILATNSRPELTSVDANLQELGRRAAFRVFEAIETGTLTPGIERLPGRLIIRGSSIARR